MLGTVLIGRIRHPYRNIAVAVIASWAMITVGGWVRFETVGNGLDAFTGQERTAAKEALDAAYCDDASYEPARFQVLKDDNGRFRVLGYTWWGLPSTTPSCGPYTRRNAG